MRNEYDGPTEAVRTDKPQELGQAIESMHEIVYMLDELKSRITGKLELAKQANIRTTEVPEPEPLQSLAVILKDGPKHLYETKERSLVKIHEIQSLLFGD